MSNNMAFKSTIRGRVRSPNEVELEESIDIPVGSDVNIIISPSLGISFAGTASDALSRFKDAAEDAAGSWKDTSESFIKEVYADRHNIHRSDVSL